MPGIHAFQVDPTSFIAKQHYNLHRPAAETGNTTIHFSSPIAAFGVIEAIEYLNGVVGVVNGQFDWMINKVIGVGNGRGQAAGEKTAVPLMTAVKNVPASVAAMTRSIPTLAPIWTSDFVRRGAAAAGGAATVTFDANASALAEFYTNSEIVLLKDNQHRICTDYTAAKVATVAPAWTVAPVAGDPYLAVHDNLIVRKGDLLQLVVSGSGAGNRPLDSIWHVVVREIDQRFAF